MPVVARLVMAMGLCAGMTAAHAQTLGDLARKTEAERKANGPAVKKLSDKDLPGVSRLEAELNVFRLTDDGFERYAGARRAMLDTRARERKIDRWLAKAEAEDAPPPVIEGMIAQEPVLSDLLDIYRILPHAYVMTEAAFNRAVTDSTRSDVELSRMPEARAANALFVRNNRKGSVAGALYQWGEAQKKLEERRRYSR